ncbi:MAG: DNA repair protein RecO [Magnetovibrio sp.]|nr:DNA repair protein RecO [Magnetovibrio sp.]
MEWHDDGIVLATRKHGESSAIVTLLTREHGRHAGLVRGGLGPRKRGLFQPGNRVRATWRARLAEHLGSYTCEMTAAIAAPFMDDRLRLTALSAICAVAEAALPERECHKPVYEGMDILLDVLDQDIWPTIFVKWEIGLLQELGFGLDFTCCAASGVTEDLTYVSPKSARAVSTDAGKPYKHALLRLPGFLIDTTQTASWPDIADGMRLTGFFLNRQVFSHTQSNWLPPARARLEALIRNMASV